MHTVLIRLFVLGLCLTQLSGCALPIIVGLIANAAGAEHPKEPPVQ